VSRRLIYTPEALADLDAAGLWLTQPGSGSGPVARRKLAALWAATERPAPMPGARLATAVRHGKL
jgi:hypothetical protein